MCKLNIFKKKKRVSWIYTINWVYFLKNCVIFFIINILYDEYIKLCTLNILNCVYFLKNVYVKYTLLDTLFEIMCTLNVQNYVKKLKNVYIFCTK